MHSIKKSNIVFAIFLNCISLVTYAQKDSLMLFDFESNLENIGQWTKTNEASCELINKDNNHELLVHSGYLTKEPGVKLLRTIENNWDLTDFYQIKAEVTNTSNKEIQVELFVGDSPDDLIRWFCSDYVDLKPNETKTITVNLAWTSWVYEPQPEINGLRGVQGKLKRNIPSIDELSFNTRYANSPSTFTIDNVRAVGLLEKVTATNVFPFLDTYGQFKHQEWKGKIHSDEELIASDLADLADIEKHSSAGNRSIYGGWKSGPKLKATGFFRTEKYNGKWWYVDPKGYLFWSAGLNCVSNNTGTTGVQYRENYFENLPKNKGAAKQFYNKSTWATHGFYKDKVPYETFNFIGYNLYRKYGNKWQKKYRERIHLRLKSWGMNTIGFMSDYGASLQQKTPYVGSIWINGTPKIEASNGYWGKFHDVFDPRFRQIVKASVFMQKTGAGDPWCIGYFVDNEMSWGLLGSLAISTLESPASQPAKIEFIKDLKDKYHSINKLNNVWKTNHKSWGDLLISTTAPDYSNAKIDLDIFYEKIAITYFKIVNEELKKVAPNQNYFGCRFAWANNDITLKSAAKYCDVISFNKYEFSVENVKLPKGVDKPIMIGEFHFGATDRGIVHPGVKVVKTQEERGLAYESYIKGALRNEQIIGAHWFQYTDEPFTGRGDGENYNVGFVDVCDNPYPELIKKVRETCYNMYEYRNEN